jgi:hypothetical protein
MVTAIRALAHGSARRREPKRNADFETVVEAITL